MSYKKFDLDKDTFTNGYFIHEGIRFYYKFLSGTAGDGNINLPNHYFSGGTSGSYYLDVYDKSKNDISANRLLSIAYGHTFSSSLYTDSGVHQEYKMRMYRLMAKRLLGDEDGQFVIDGEVLNEAIFLCVARNQYKDAMVGKGTLLWYYLDGVPGAEPIAVPNYATLTDYSSKLDNSFCGPYTYLLDLQSNKNKGLVYLNAGIVVVDPKILPQEIYWSGSQTYADLAKEGQLKDLLWGIKHRFWYWDFSGSSKVESSYFRCTAQPDEFNYSANPSFRNSEGEIVTSISSSTPTTYITQVALLGENQEKIAVAKLIKPVKKNPYVGVTITVRLDH